MKKKKKDDLDRNMKLKKNQKINMNLANNPQAAKKLTNEELQEIEKEEIDLLTSKATQSIQMTHEKLDKLKLTKTQELLLRKLVDFSTLQNYDVEHIKKGLYNLFFDWTQE